MAQLPERPNGALAAELLEHLFDISSEGIAVLRLDGGAIIAANHAFCAVIGYPRDEVIGRSPAELGLVDLEYQEKIFAALEELRSIPPTRVQIVTKDGSRKDAEFLVDLSEMGGEPIMIGFVSDVTEKQRAEKLLERSEALFRSVAETAVDAIVSADADGRITFFNKAAERVFGYPAAEVMGRPVTMLMPERFHDSHRAGLMRDVDAGEERVIGRTIAVEGRRADGTEFPVEIALSGSADGRKLFTAIIRDLTERDAAERALRDLAVARERQRLLDRMVDAVEKERLRIAMDLHDGPIQHLAAIMMRLHTLHGAIEARDFDAALARLEGLEGLLGNEVSEIRAMMSNLVPTTLAEHGLSVALADLVADIADSSEGGPEIVAESLDGGRLTAAAEIALFRIAQEALANALNHTSSGRIEIRLSATEDHVVLTVSDDGHGFDVDTVGSHPGVEHFGISVMRERAEMVGGTLEIRSAAGQGTEVLARVPRQIG